MLTSLLKAFLQAHRLDGVPVLAGFSGGADSTALLLALHQANARVTAVHFNHGIRGREADDDELWCRNLCQSRNIPLHVLQLDVPNNTRHGESTEEAGRRLRLQAWHSLAGHRPVFLAHHADDALEELFLRLARGSNVSGIVPLKPERVINGVRFLRPLLHVQRADIEHWLADIGVTDWRIDSTNADNTLRRNAVRNRLLPLFRDIFGHNKGLITALNSLEEDADFIDCYARELYAKLHSASDWRTLPPAILARCTRMRLAECGLDSVRLTRPFLKRLYHELQRGRTLLLTLDANVTACISKDGLSFHVPDAWPERQWDWRTNPLAAAGPLLLHAGDAPVPDALAFEAFDSDALPSPLTLRRWVPGDRMTPFGAKSPKKLQDLFTDAAIPRPRRSSLPLLLADKLIIWVPTVRRAEFARVLPDHPKVILSVTQQKDT